MASVLSSLTLTLAPIMSTNMLPHDRVNKDTTVHLSRVLPGTHLLTSPNGNDESWVNWVLTAVHLHQTQAIVFIGRCAAKRRLLQKYKNVQVPLGTLLILQVLLNNINLCNDIMHHTIMSVMSSTDSYCVGVSRNGVFQRSFIIIYFFPTQQNHYCSVQVCFQNSYCLTLYLLNEVLGDSVKRYEFWKQA